MGHDLRKLIFELKDEFKIFDFLSDEEMEKLIPYFDLVLYPAGTVLFNEGDPGDSIGFVVSGKLEVKKHTEFKGKQIILALLSRGALVGELSIIDEEPRSATVVALEDSELLLVKRNDIDIFMHTSPHIGIKLLKGISLILSIRLRKAVDRLTVIF